MRERRGREGTARSGIALIEVVVVAGVLMVGSLGFVSIFGASSELGRSSRETAIAAEAARRVLENLEAFEPHADVFALHNDDPNDDPGTAAPIDGFTLSGFAVDGLVAPEGDVDGLVGQVIFPIDPVTGLVRPGADDLDVARLQGVIDRIQASGGAAPGLELVPVIVRLEWDAGGRVRSHEVYGLLAPR